MNGFTFRTTSDAPNTEPTWDAVLQRIAQLSEYRALHELIGDHAEVTAQSIYRYIRRFAVNAFQMHHGGAACGSDIEMMCRGLNFEREMFMHNRRDIEEVWQQAMQGVFHPMLRGGVEASQHNGAKPQDSDLTKAVSWIHSPSGDGHPTSADEFVIKFALEGVEPIVGTGAVAMIKLLHQKLVPQQGLAPDRRPQPGTWYCGTGGGRALQDGIDILANTFAMVPGDADPRWDDLACLLYGANVRAQAFSDGNKRASRAIYAAILRRGNRPFAAPADALERILLGQFRN